MKEKIMNIKNILKIIISLFVIFSITKSCAKAYTYSEFVDYCYLVVQSDNTTSTQKTMATWVINNQGTISTKFGDTISNYNSWVVGLKTGTQGFKRIYGIQGGVFDSWNTNTILKNYTSSKNVIQYDYNSGWNSSGTTLTPPNNAIIGLIDSSIATNVDFTGRNWNDLLAAQNPMYYGHLFSTNATYQNQELEVVQTLYSYRQTPIESLIGYTSGETIQIRLTNTSNNQIFENTYKWNENVYIGRNSNKSFYANDLGDYLSIGINTSLIYFNTIYSLEVTQGENIIQEYIIFMPIGTIIENGIITSIPSGDFTYTTQDSTNQIIENQNENNNWWQDTYNNLFVMESGDVKDIIEDMKANLQVSNIGDMSGEIAILNTLTGEPGDFVIAWNPTQYLGKIIIPSGDINFSQKVREVPALQTTQNWLRIIMGYSISIVLLSEIFFTILKVLGVSVSIYDQHNEEIERLEEMHAPKIYDTEVLTPKGIKRYRTRRTRIQ